jgi:hypothetical protein
MTLANPLRGEVILHADGRPHVLRLSLGALAALEASIAPEGLVDLAERIERGGMRMSDVIVILTAGFAGAGTPMTRDDVAEMAFEGGATEASRVAVALIAAAFRVEEP